MTNAATSLKVFGAYLVLVGAGLLLAPALVLGTLAIPAPQEVWVRVLGAVTLVLSTYYWVGAASGHAPIYRATIVGRFAFALLSVVIVLAYAGPPQLLVFGAVDVAFASWTALAMRGAPAH